MKKPRIVIFCGGSARHLYVANQLADATETLAIVMETGRSVTAGKLFKQALNGMLLRKVWRKLRDLPRYAGDKEAAFFFPNETPRLKNEALKVEVPTINDVEVLQLLDEQQPDIIAVFGTSLLRNELLSSTTAKVVNLHGGLSPWYRGADCTFWALHNKEPERVGCTLHYIDPGIDTGDLIAHVSPEVRQGDDELTLFWRGVRDSAAVYAEALVRIGNGESLGVRQQSSGSLYQVKDRLWIHERRLKQHMEQGMLENLSLPQRVNWFERDQQDIA